MDQTSNPYQAPPVHPEAKDTRRPSKVRVPLFRRLPPVCALCGDPSVTERTMILSGIGGEIQNLQRWTSEGAPVALPLCQRHRSFRRGWPAIGRALLCFPLAMVVLILPPLTLILRGHILTLLVVSAVLVGIDVLTLVWLIAKSLRIRASRLSSKDVVLVGVAPEFVQACEEMQRQEVETVIDSLGRAQ